MGVYFGVGVYFGKYGSENSNENPPYFPQISPFVLCVQEHCSQLIDATLSTDETQRIGVFFDPSMKHLVPLFTDSEANAIRRAVKALLPQRMPTFYVASPTALNKFKRFAGTGAPSSGNSAAVAVRDDVDVYLSYSPPPEGQSVLAFWKSQEGVLPELTAVARRILSIPAASTAAETIFRNAGNIFAAKRSGDEQERLDDLLYLMWHSRTWIFWLPYAGVFTWPCHFIICFMKLEFIFIATRFPIASSGCFFYSRLKFVRALIILLLFYAAGHEQMFYFFSIKKKLSTGMDCCGVQLETEHMAPPGGATSKKLDGPKTV